MRRRRWTSALTVLALAASASAAVAAGGAGSEGGGAPQNSGQPSAQTTGAQDASVQSSLGPAGDPGGVRAALAQRGVTYNLVFIGEVLGNPTGGTRRGAIAEGRFDLQLDVDLAKAANLDGAALHANAYGIVGDGLTRRDLLDLSVASNIEALRSTRLYEAWFEQTAMGGTAAVKIGQIGADTEFIVSHYATLFVNSTFGWPNVTAYDLPSGGPAYPLATPGVRLKLSPDAHTTVLAAMFDGDPAGGARQPSADPQVLDRDGTNFRVTDRPLAIAEAAYSYGDKGGAVLPGTAKLGGWRHFGDFSSQRDLDADGASGATAGPLRGDDGIYGVVDQMVYRVPGTDDGAVGIFVRLSGSPPDRNLVSFYADGGLTGKGVVPGRPDDTLGLSFAYTQISADARAADIAREAALGTYYPRRSNETLVELTYQAEVVPGFSVQPDVQYVVRPGGNIPDPRSATLRPIRDAAVFGLRATIQY